MGSKTEMSRHCCDRFDSMIDEYVIKEEKHGRQKRFFVHLQPFYKAPFMFVSTRLKYCLFCGAKLK